MPLLLDNDIIEEECGNFPEKGAAKFEFKTSLTKKFGKNVKSQRCSRP